MYKTTSTKRFHVDIWLGYLNSCRYSWSYPVLSWLPVSFCSDSSPYHPCRDTHMPIDAGLSGIILLNDYASHITTVGSEAEKVATRAFIQNEINIVRSYTIALIALCQLLCIYFIWNSAHRLYLDVFSLSVYRDDLPPKAASRRKPMDPELVLLSSMLANSSSSEREHAPTTSSQHKHKSLAPRGQGYDSNLTLYDPPSACVTSPSGALFDRVPSRG